ncbi:RagB/SusD family nutrient uptake outer membrane protein [Marinifilum caeruleilacunae]|uniref:RagB/SusD family nutrient uptake outer membrane protein n=1 Tax=Marinifilum caeruleilacunae TaxID=2499076 RepID=A0ABX1X0J3_9BACT|nr:RagB/SusD family nutrient uptake outer membrane protein [Marinifilum caeruleilacunae]NOU61731.1 RagB/SusD family nutrient uptake outer membrane protein [Marinifilum caeruleilacunae]
MKKINILSKIAMLFVFVVAMNACTTDDLEPSTEQNKAVEGGIASSENLYGVLKGAYSRMTESGYYGRDYIINNEVRSDNCFSNGNSGRFTTQAGFNYSANTGYFWDEAYEVIASANIVIGVNAEDLTGSQDYIKHMQGQAYVMRALVHFDLVKQYGQQHAGGTLGVPYVTEYKGDNLYPARNTVAECENFIMQDLATGFGLMSTSQDPSNEFITKYAAKAIESSVAVYFGDWAAAIAAAEAVMNNTDYDIIPAGGFVSSFASDVASNSIFELAFSSTDNRGINGLAYIYRTTGGGSYGDVQVIDDVINLYEVGDVRADILGYEGIMLRNIGKFPDNQGYDNVGVIRYEEVVLNYAEALFRTGDEANALIQINSITSNRGASAYSSPLTADDFLLERRKEFIFEGKRFEDLVRFGKNITKEYLQQNFSETIPYGDYRIAYPITQAEIDANSNIVQNTGY